MSKAMVWGAGGGIGSALVKRLVDDGWAVIGVARDVSAVPLDPSSVVEADVADEAAVRAAVRAAVQGGDEEEAVDLWIYAVGDIASAKVADMAAEDWRRILDANLTGAYLAAHHSLPLLAEDAHMVFLGAVSERMRLPGLAAYAAAKAGIEAFAEALRKEQRGRHVTIVRPKAVETPLWDKVPFRIPKHAMRPEELAERILAAVQEGHTGVLNL